MHLRLNGFLDIKIGSQCFMATCRTDNAIKNRYYSTMRRMQRQSIRKKGPMREGKSIRVATVNSSPMPTPRALTPQQQHQQPLTRGLAPPTPQHQQQQQQPPSTFQKLFAHSSSDRERVRDIGEKLLKL